MNGYQMPKVCQESRAISADLLLHADHVHSSCPYVAPNLMEGAELKCEKKM